MFGWLVTYLSIYLLYSTLYSTLISTSTPTLPLQLLYSPQLYSKVAIHFLFSQHNTPQGDISPIENLPREIYT